MSDRQSFGTLKAVIEPPDLIELQLKSFEDFLQLGVAAGKRENKGLQAIFKEVFPIESNDGRYVLDFVRYDLAVPDVSPYTCLYAGTTYAASLHATFRLKDGDEFREEEVYLGEMPLMTHDGAFIVNGAERVIVSQMHRSPGVCSEVSEHANGSRLFSVRIIPDRGSWIEIQFDTSDLMWVYLDRRRRRRKFLATTFLRALGLGSDEAVLDCFYSFETLDTNSKYSDEDLTFKVLKEDIIDVDSQAVLARRYEELSKPMLAQIKAAGFQKVEVVNVAMDEGVMLKTLAADPTRSEEEALRDIYHRLRPGDPATPSNARQLLKRMFMEHRRYDLGLVGRYKINKKLRSDNPAAADYRVLEMEDVLETLRHLLEIRQGRDEVDDIDHLGNRRVRTPGELLENQCRLGLGRTERLIRERMTLFDPSTGLLTPARLVNSKSLAAVLQDFFGRSQLSQFMDQTNPLSSLAHKRRLSALGPGGLSRERAGFDVRDVHSSHYGRICPIETPEGPNIGLISSLGIYGKVNRFGFIESPYRRVVNGKVTDQVDFLTADAEEGFRIAQANAQLDESMRFAQESMWGRYASEFIEVRRDEVEYMDVTPMQIVSIAAGLIPFLEHDDANRALMGANMMRQAVPLLKAERPYVATGLEEKVASDSRVVVKAGEDGVVASVKASEILVTPDGKVTGSRSRRETQRYRLRKFQRTNAGTCFNQKPIVAKGQKVSKGDVLADGPSTRDGELSIGKNLLVAFMPWSGYNFEDAIVISQRVVRDDVFTSLHIQEFEVGARDTKLGPEEITRDIPNVGEDALRNLGPDGVIRVGAEVRPGDILVGKITPKSETELAPEERLLRAIFGEKAADVRDTSLTVPSGVEGIVMEVKTSCQTDGKPEGSRKRKSGKRVRESRPADRKKKHEALVRELTEELSKMLLGEKIPLDVLDAETNELLIPANRKITKKLLARLAERHNHVQIDNSPVQLSIEQIIDGFRPKFEGLDADDEMSDIVIDEVSADDDGVLKQVRVLVACKKNLSVGDKLAGRHGNKGVVAKIVPECDMPYLPDGTPVDILLNPLGVPSRMNLGQLFETAMGTACKALGIKVASPIFDGIPEPLIREYLARAGKVAGGEWIKDDGKTVLYDGRTGEPFGQRVVVGQIYMIKLHHLVTDKIHARAVGPYSLVTQQPLGGKAQYGGQRLGEMEVWALEAYGVAYALQEMLTVKSDDVSGRTRIYESIVKDQNTLEAGMPESFSVLMHELRGLCLDMKLLNADKETRRF